MAIAVSSLAGGPSRQAQRGCHGPDVVCVPARVQVAGACSKDGSMGGGMDPWEACPQMGSGIEFSGED